MKPQYNNLEYASHPNQQNDEKREAMNNGDGSNAEALLSKQIVQQDSGNSEESDTEADELSNFVQMGRTMAHQLNNLLTTILANAQLASLMIDNEEVKSYLNVVEEATGDAGTMVRRFQESIYKLVKPSE